MKFLLLLTLLSLPMIAHATSEDQLLEQFLETRSGNTETLSLSAPGFYNNAEGSPLIPLIDQAKRTIDIEIYMMEDKDLHEALRRAMKERHVRVRVIKDPTPLGETCSPFKAIDPKDKPECKSYKQLAIDIKAAGGEFVAFNKKELCGIEGKSCYEHGKMVIIDNKKVMLSTGNFNSSNLCNLSQNPSKCNRDFSFVGRRRYVIKNLEAIFEQDLIGKRYDVSTLMGRRFSKKVTVSPLSEAALIRFIQSAKHSIEIENQYLKEEAFNQALMEAAKKGIRVTVTLASACSFGKPSEKQTQDLTRLYQSFDEAGIETWMFTSKILVSGKPGYMHAKAIVVDGRRAWLGSVNGSSMSMNQNREYGYFFWNPFAVRDLRNIIRSDHTHPDGESWQDSLNCVKDATASGDDSGE